MYYIVSTSMVGMNKSYSIYKLHEDIILVGKHNFYLNNPPVNRIAGISKKWDGGYTNAFFEPKYYDHLHDNEGTDLSNINEVLDLMNKNFIVQRKLVCECETIEQTHEYLNNLYVMKELER